MASLPPGTRVGIYQQHLAAFLFPPPGSSELYVAIHPSALKHWRTLIPSSLVLKAGRPSGRAHLAKN
jgi:hypothetical protein